MTTTENPTDELEIDVGGATPPGKEIEVDLETGKEAELAKEVPVEDEGIKSLKSQMEAMRAASAERERQLERDKAAALEEAAKAKTQVGESNYQVVVSAIEATKREGDQAEAEYKSAMETGDYAAAAKAQRVMARVESRLDQLDGARQNIETIRSKPPRVEGAVREPPRVERPVDPVEALASVLSPASAAWVRKHESCATDPVLYQEMVAADARAKRMGHAPDSPEYFRFIEQRLGFSEPEPVKVEPAPQRRAIPSAPVSREAPGTVGGRRTYKMSPEEQEAARDSGMTNEEYAKEKLKYLVSEGRA